MTSWLVWIVIATIAVFLTAIGYWFSVRTLRIVTLIIALVLLVVITRYGLTRPAKTPPDLANSFTRGADALSVAFSARSWRWSATFPRPAGSDGSLSP
jgi:hypothetical protein